MPLDIFVFAGEASGDLHGERVLKALLSQNPDLHIEGVGGPKMRPYLKHCLMPMEQFQVMGFIDVFKALPRLIPMFKKVKQAILDANPALVLLIDYPGMNLRMAKALRKANFKGKIVQYICPTVWAWGKGRIKEMTENLDMLLALFPFEAEIFFNTPLKAHCIGHPLVEKIENHPYVELPLPKDKRLISLFPGSRKKEIEMNFPIYLRAIKKIQESFSDLAFAVSVSQPAYIPLLQKIMNEEGALIPLVSGEKTYELMRYSHLAIAKSGTVTLELALHEVPTVVTYGLSTMDLFIAKNLLRIRLPHYCIVNILLNKTIFPELIGPRLTTDSLYESMMQFLREPRLRHACRAECSVLPGLLRGDDQLTAKIIINEMCDAKSL